MRIKVIAVNIALALWLISIYLNLIWIDFRVALAYTLALTIIIYIVLRILLCPFCPSINKACPYGFNKIAKFFKERPENPVYGKILALITWIFLAMLVPLTISVYGVIMGKQPYYNLLTLILLVLVSLIFHNYLCCKSCPAAENCPLKTHSP